MSVELASTRERIVGAASTLFASKGYAGTSTREIAAMVDIRQPSLFHHFPTKAAIAEFLLDESLGRMQPLALELAAERTSPAVRLYGWVSFETRYLATSRHNLTGLWADNVLESDEFRRWGEANEQLHAAIAEIIRDGVAREEFVLIDPDFAQQVVSSLNQLTIRTHYGQTHAWAAQFADDVAIFALRALLAAISQLPEVRKQGVEVAQRLLTAALGEERAPLKPPARRGRPPGARV